MPPRPIRIVVTALAVASSLASFVLHAEPAHGGRWITESGNLEVEIAPCGDALCGTVTRSLANRSMRAGGQEMAPADQRPALGMVILTGLRDGGDDTLRGEIYNRENAKTYSVRLSMDGPQQLLVRAYVGLPLFGKTQIWRRAEANAAAAEAKP